ncbi:uncharacterized protein MCYG_05890 [Microsporum canis CBS 113480]|uniref:Uncharacterized protein n=1 Tax=Arthroderma otae (strain ATCC MYA-4605 / CBS 113480) TaxID=554155 RepID=C5FT68_ARTOC|nr:uncharacterized protein MCYG_05890 [Microsporum canis CBS 113480]EEQ33071.1 predicted protein [Microsporum canis CBS 113480]
MEHFCSLDLIFIPSAGQVRGRLSSRLRHLAFSVYMNMGSYSFPLSTSAFARYAKSVRSVGVKARIGLTKQVTEAWARLLLRHLVGRRSRQGLSRVGIPSLHIIWLTGCGSSNLRVLVSI